MLCCNIFYGLLYKCEAVLLDCKSPMDGRDDGIQGFPFLPTILFPSDLF